MLHISRKALVALGAVAVGALCLVIARPADAARTGTANLIDTNGNPAGVVTFSTSGSQTTVEARIQIPEVAFEGFHGFHVHATGVCDPRAVDTAGVATPFFTAGGHYSETPQGHRSHDGDMPSTMVLRNGSAHLRFVTDRFTVDELKAGDGSAVIMHVGPDNFANIPTRYTPAADETTHRTGDSGGRLLCGVLK